MASRFVRPTVLTTKKKTLQDDLEKRKKQNAGIDEAQAYMDYIKTLTPTQQNATKNQEAQAAVSTTKLRPIVPSLPDWKGQGGMNYALSRQALLTSEQMISENRAVGLYDTEQVAYNPDTAHLASTDYLKRLQEALGTRMETSRAQDEQNKARLGQYDSDLEDWYLNLEGNKPTDWDLKALDTIKNGREYASSYELKDEERGRLTDEYLQLVARMKPDYEYQSQTPTLQAKWDALDKEIQRRNTGYQEISNELRSSPTFLTDSVYTPMTGESYAQYVKEHTGLGWFGQLADRIDKSNDTAVLYDYMMNPQYALEYDLTNDVSYRNKGYNLLTDDEKLEAAAAMARGEETFTRWLSSFEATGTLTRRRAMLDKAQQENLALHPLTAVPMYGAARMADVVSSVMAIPQAAAALAGYDDPNSMLYASNNFSQNVGSVQEQAAGELMPWQVPFTNQKFGSLLYNGVSSVLNFALARGIGGSGKAATAITQYIMSSQAASNTIYNALEEGQDPTEAVVRGMVSGAIEAFTEKYSIEALLKNPSMFAAFVGQNMATEASEEVLSSVLNTGADWFISKLYGHEDALTTEYAALKAQLGDPKEASRQVLQNFLLSLGTDAVLGGFTGGAMGTAVGAQTSAQRNAVGKEVSALGNVSKLVDIGLTMDVNGESNPLARTIKQAEADGKKVSNRQVGRLYETMYRELDEQSRAVMTDTMRDAVAQRMVELGDSPDVAQEAADAVLAVVRNEKPSLGQRQSMARAQSSTQVIKEIMFADDATSEGRMRHSKWVRTADEKANAAGAASLRKMGELRQTRVGKETTDQTIQRATVNAQQLVAKKATDKKSMDVELEDGQSAEILQVSNAEGEAKVTIKGADGQKQTVSASDLRIKSRPVAAIVSYLDTTSERMSDEQANLLLHSYTGGDAAEHIADFNDAYAAGFMARELPPSKRMDRRMAQQIAEQGRKDAEVAEQKRQATIGAIATGRRGTVTFTENMADTGSEKALKAVSDRLSDTQKKSVAAIKQLARATGVNFVFFESQADDTGRYTAENGHYDVKTGTIYLDLNSGKNSTTDLAEYAILRTAGHELTHFMEHSSKEGYAALRDFVTTELTRRGEDFDALVVKKMDNAARSGAPLTRAGAISEVVADASELMLRDTKAIERLAQKDQGLMAKIKGFIQSFVQKVRDAFSGVDAVHEEARVMMQELAEEFQQKWDFALEEAVEKAREGVQEDAELQEAVQDVQFSIRDGQMTPESTEQERYDILKNAVLRLATVQPDKLADIDLESYNTRKKSDVEKNIRALANKLGIMNVDLQNSQISFPFQFTNKNLGKSLHHQLDYGGTYQDYVKAMSCLDEIVESAIPIETHIDKKRGTGKEEPGLKQVYVLVGAFSDGMTITPVQLEIKENRYRGNKLYLTVMLTKINPEVVENGLAAQGGSVRPLFSGSTISLRSLIENVNTKDYKFFKYIPDQFLNKEQKAAKERALQAQEEEYAGYGEKQRSLRDMPADLTREYVANLTASDALNDVEKDAIRIYSREVGLLRAAQEKLGQVIAERDAQPEDKQKMYAQRVRDLRQMVSNHYDRLTQLEKTKGVAPLIQRSREYVQEYVQGKTAQDVENLITSTEQEVERLNKLIQAGNKDLVKERDRRINDLRQLRNQATQKLLDEQTRYRQMIATDREVRKLTQQARQMQEKIATHVRKLDKLRRQETDYKNIPEAFKPAVDTLVSMFTDNFGTMVFDKQRADRLSAIYHKLLTVDGNDPMATLKPFYDPNMEEYLEALTEWAEKDAQLRTASGTRMEKAQLRLAINKGVLDAVDHITTIVTNAQNLFYAGKKAKFDAIGTQMGDALKARQDKKTLRGAAGQALTVMDNLLRTGNMTPVYFFEQLGNEVLSTLWDDIRQGQNAYAFAMRDGRETIQGLQQLYHYWDWADSKRKDNVLEITTEKGRRLTFTREQALWVYATWKREQSNEIAATKHLTEGGIVYEGKKQEGGKVVTTVQSTPAVLSEGDIVRITGWLTDEQKAYADGMVRYLSEDMAELGNRASMEMFGIRKYTESYYFPYRTERDQLYQSSASGRLDTTSDSRIKHASFTHPLTKGASAPLVMGDFSAAVEDHIAHMATYASFVLPIESMNRVLNYKVTLTDDSRATVRSLIEQKYGESAKKYIATLLTDLNGGVRNDNRASGTDYLVRMYKKGAVAASLSTALQQPTSLFRAMAMISPKYIAASTFSKRDWDELTRYSGVAVIKDMGRFDTDVGRSNIDWLHKKHPRGFMERLDAASGFLPEQLDRLTWAHLWSAVKKEQADLHPEMDKQSEAFLALCGERFNDIVDHTQVYDSILSRSQLMRGKDAMSKMTTSFMAEPTLAINMLYNAAAGFTKPGGKVKAAKVMAAVLTSNIAAAAMAALIQAWNDDDDNRSAQTKYLDKFLENALDNNNPLSMLPVVSDVWSMFQGYDVQRADMSLISEMYKAIQRFQSDSYSPYRKMEELLGTTAKFFGLPVKNLLRDGRRAYNLFASSFESPSSYELTMALPWADDKATAHYEELFLAMHNGDTKREEEIRGYLTDVKDKQTDAQNEGVRDRLKERFLGGSMDEAAAKAWLKTHMGYDNRKAFETVDRWRETQENKGNEEWSYSIYNDFYDAVESGKNLNKEIKQLLDLGIEAKTLAGNITTEFKPLLLELLATGKTSQAAALQAKILDAYVALGYDREKKLKDVKKWYSK